MLIGIPCYSSSTMWYVWFGSVLLVCSAAVECSNRMMAAFPAHVVHQLNEKRLLVFACVCFA